MNIKNNIFTIPNFLSSIRIILIAPIVYYIDKGLNKYLYTILLLLFIQSVSDFLDGFIARRFGQISDLGKILDPIADKLTFDAIMISLLKYGFPLIFVIIFLFRDIVILFLGYKLIRNTNNIPVSNIFGKFTTFSMALYLFTFILNLKMFSNILYYVVICAIISSIVSYSLLYKKINKVR